MTNLSFGLFVGVCFLNEGFQRRSPLFAYLKIEFASHRHSRVNFSSSLIHYAVKFNNDFACQLFSTRNFLLAPFTGLLDHQ